MQDDSCLCSIGLREDIGYKNRKLPFNFAFDESVNDDEMTQNYRLGSTFDLILRLLLPFYWPF